MSKRLAKGLTPAQIQFVREVIKLMNQGSHEEAHTKIKIEFGKIEFKKPTRFGADLACLLIDAGFDSNSLESVEAASKYIAAHFEQLKKETKVWSLHYNLGNAKSATFKILRRRNGGRYSLKVSEVLVDAKNQFWKAFKLLVADQATNQSPEALVNLSNTLNSSGRIAESLTYLDQALDQYPEFYMAHVNRSAALEWLWRISDAPSPKLIREIASGYEFAIANAVESKIVEAAKRDLNVLNKHPAKKNLPRLDDDDNEISAKGFEALPDLRKRHVRDHLSLNEHSLYCQCGLSATDSLTIPVGPIKADNLLAKMEHWLNRFKSEFSLARKFYYDFILASKAEAKKFDCGMHLVNLQVNEMTSYEAEQLRVSFRMCVGILDKIAEAICELYDLAKPKEAIYFDRFWKSDKHRWEKINDIQNYSLMALYSQATDLNQESGEWIHFKKWRNALEHGLLVILKDRTPTDEFRILEGRQKITLVDEKDFSHTILHLLQFTRSAIFNFTFCARKEFSRKSKEMKGRRAKRVKLTKL